MIADFWSMRVVLLCSGKPEDRFDVGTEKYLRVLGSNCRFCMPLVRCIITKRQFTYSRTHL